jgi:hypothetical protein
MNSLQRREERWAIVDLVIRRYLDVAGYSPHLRTITIPEKFLCFATGDRVSPALAH